MRNRIMMAAIDEASERGIKFTMNDLARRLAVSKSTLYEHFDSKEELIGAIIDTLVADLRRQEQEITSNNTLSFSEKFKSLLSCHPKTLGIQSERFMDDVKRYMPGEWAKMEAFIDNRWRMIEDLLRQGIEAGYFRPVNLAVVQRILFGAVNELLDYKFLMQNNLTILDAIAAAFDILILGMAVPAKTGDHI
ncbi:MAG: TetR/AcrR family transcriptional regulator [Desulfotomaculaceae bacterium]